LKEEIAQIKGSLSQERSEYQATREKLTPLLKEKKEAFRAADEVFKKTMTEAKSDLKDAFKDYQSTAEAEE
jgi:dsDNA-specific endonuclease/ATPase MutS2